MKDEIRNPGVGKAKEESVAGNGAKTEECEHIKLC